MDLDDHPYRSPPTTIAADEPRDAWDEQALLYAAIAAIGGLRVVVAILGGERFGTEPTIGLIMLALAMIGLVWRERSA